MDYKYRTSVRGSSPGLRTLFVNRDQTRPDVNVNDTAFGSLPVDQVKYMSKREVDPMSRNVERRDYDRSLNLRQHGPESLRAPRFNRGMKELLFPGQLDGDKIPRWGATVMVPKTNTYSVHRADGSEKAPSLPASMDALFN
jgi:hypothetical protein